MTGSGLGARARQARKLLDAGQEIDGDEVNFPGVSVVFYPSNAIQRMYNEVGDAQGVERLVLRRVCLLIECARNDACG